MLRPFKPDASRPQPLWLLRPSDQRVLAVLAGGVLIALAIAWWAHGGPRGALIPYERLRAQSRERPPVKFLVDINRAPWPELAELPRIGPVLAQRIVEHREAHGPFRTAAELREVRGIGPQTLEGVLPYLMPLAE